MSLCPEAEYRATLTDDEFWEHVFHGHRPEPDEYDPTHEDIGPTIGVPCPECGTRDACGYDDMGRPMIHVIEEATG